jgi:hypothetical protein
VSLGTHMYGSSFYGARKTYLRSPHKSYFMNSKFNDELEKFSVCQLIFGDDGGQDSVAGQQSKRNVSSDVYSDDEFSATNILSEEHYV